MSKKQEEADAIYILITEGWSDREIYHAEPEELTILLTSGGSAVEWNHDQGDGSFTHKVRYKGKIFMASTDQELS